MVEKFKLSWKLCVLIVSLFSIVLVVGSSLRLGLGIRRLTGGGGTPTAAPIERLRFCVVAFPVSADSMRLVDRAVLLSLSELEQSSVEIFVDGKPRKFNVDEFSVTPPSETERRYVHRLNQTMEVWKEETDWSSASLFVNRMGVDGEVVVKLSLHHKKGSEYEFLYRVPASGGVYPVWKVVYL